jgi:transcriptional regulator with XRE-family HTH domain
MGTKLHLDGAKIRALRIQRGWTQEQLAEIAGVSSRTIQRAETGDCAAFETVRAVAGAFEVDFNHLLKTETCSVPDPQPPAPASLPGPGRPAKFARPARSVRRAWTTLTVAVGALAAGVVAGVILTHRVDKPVGSDASAPRLISAVPAPAETLQEARHPGPSAQQVFSVLTAGPDPTTGAAIPKRDPEAEPHNPGSPKSVARAAESYDLPDPLPLAANHLSSDAAPLDLSLQPRELPPTLVALEAPVEWSTLFAIPDSLARNDQGDGAVRHAIGQAGKKTGEALARVGASVKRVF